MAITKIYPIYQYSATLIRCIDGDTALCIISMGFNQYFKSPVRLALINTPELNDPDPIIRASALAAKKTLSDYLPAGTKVIIDSRKQDPYGRPIALIYKNGLLAEETNAYMIRVGWERYAVTLEQKLLIPPKVYA